MRRRRRAAALAAAAWIALGILAGASGAAGEGEAELEVLRRAIEERRERVAAFEREERGLFEAIRAVDDAVAALRQATARAAEEAREAQQEARALEARQQALGVQAERTRGTLGRRAVALYKAGALGPVRMVFAEGSLRDRLGRIRLLQRMVDQDERLLARYAEEREALEHARQEAEAAVERRDAARDRLAARRAELESERAGKRSLLLDVRRDRARERAVLNELEAAARALEETLSRLREAPPAPPAGFAARRGSLELPVVAPVVRRFGRVVDAQYRTETFRKGVDFGAQTGDPVYAVADGTVRFAGWFRGYGKLVILDHGDDYFTVSGHLDAIAVEVGDRVRAGDTLGSAGETGSLSGPRLYFEIRHGGQALDPAEWLRLLPEG